MYVDSHTSVNTNPKMPFANGAYMSLNNVGDAQTFFFNRARHFSFTPKSFEPHEHFCYQKSTVQPDVDSQLDMTSTKRYTFRIAPEHDILLGYYLSFTLPDIYSPIYPPSETTGGKWAPYEFKWIDDFCEVIADYEVSMADTVIFRGDGKSMRLFMNRDLNDVKLQQFNELVGAVPELHNPSGVHQRYHVYPNCFYSASAAANNQQPEPSIRGRMIMIPLHFFFHPSGFPFCLTQRNTPLVVRVDLRPICDWFRVRDVFDPENQFPRVRPEFNEPQFALYRFLQPPPSVDISPASYISKPLAWEANLHLVTEFAALTQKEREHYQSRTKAGNVMLVRSIRRHVFQDLQGYFEATIHRPVQGYVTCVMIAPQRGDVARRNEWSNYTNWPYRDELPSNIISAATNTDDFDLPWRNQLPPLNLHQDNIPTGICVTAPATGDNEKYIMATMSILFDGNVREKELPFDVYHRLDILNKCPGAGTDGTVCYMFSKNSAPSATLNQPAGIQNWGSWNRIAFSGTTIVPALNPRTNIPQQFLCNERGDTMITVAYNNFSAFDYKFTLHIYEESINMILFDKELQLPQMLYVP